MKIGRVPNLTSLKLRLGYVLKPLDDNGMPDEDIKFFSPFMEELVQLDRLEHLELLADRVHQKVCINMV